MRHTLAALAACLLAASLAGCSTPGGQAAATTALDVGAQIGSQIAAVECARLTKKSAALASTCVTDAGAAITIADAAARGLIAGPATGAAK